MAAGLSALTQHRYRLDVAVSASVCHPLLTAA